MPDAGADLAPAFLRRRRWGRRNYSGLMPALAMTRHLGFLAGRIVRQAASQYRLKELPIEDASWHRPIGVIRRKGGYLSPVARRFIEILETTAKRD